MTTRTGLGCALALLILAGSGAVEATATEAPPPIVVGHRGAPGYRPEHTLASYELAARMGADYVETDLVITKDGVLVARHENEISQTTDVAKHREFRSRKTTKRVDGKRVTGWFTEDFTLAELRTLRASERIPEVRPRNTAYNGRYRVPTFQEVVDLTRRLSRELGREIGLYPETKHPTYFRARNLPLEEPLVAALRANGLDRADAKAFVQSFEVGNLKRLNRMTNVRLVQLLDDPGDRPWDVRVARQQRTYRDLATRRGLASIAEYADGVGPNKDYVIRPGRRPSAFVANAHAAGLVVHPYTFRSENRYLPPQLRSGGGPNARGRAAAEYKLFYAAGVDGVFSDFPDVAVRAR